MCGAGTKVQGGSQNHFFGYKSFFLPLGDEVSRQVIFIAGLRQDPSEKINKVTHTSPSHPSAPSLERGPACCADTGTPPAPEGPRKLLPACREAGGPRWGRGPCEGHRQRSSATGPMGVPEERAETLGLHLTIRARGSSSASTAESHSNSALTPPFAKCLPKARHRAQSFHAHFFIIIISHRIQFSKWPFCIHCFVPLQVPETQEYTTQRHVLRALSGLGG